MNHNRETFSRWYLLNIDWLWFELNRIFCCVQFDFSSLATIILTLSVARWVATEPVQWDWRIVQPGYNRLCDTAARRNRDAELPDRAATDGRNRRIRSRSLPKLNTVVIQRNTIDISLNVYMDVLDFTEFLLLSKGIAISITRKTAFEGIYMSKYQTSHLTLLLKM